MKTLTAYPCPACNATGTKRWWRMIFNCRYCKGSREVSMVESLEWHRAYVLKSLKMLEGSNIPRWIKGGKP